MGGARMQGAAMCNAQTLGVQSAWMPGNQGSMGCEFSMAMGMARFYSPAIVRMAMQMQQLVQQPPPQMALQPQAQCAGSPLMPSVRRPMMQPMMQPMGQSSWQRPAQQPQAQWEAQKTEVPQPRAQQEAQKTEGQKSGAQRKPRRTEREIYALIRREQRKLEEGNRRKVKKTTTTKRPQRRAQQREGGKPGEKNGAAQASSGGDGMLEVGALAVGQAKSEEQLTAYGGGQSEVQ